MSLNLATLNLGDKFSFGKYAVANETPWPIVWSVMHRTDTYIACMAEWGLDHMQFDSAEPTSVNTDQRTGGNNQYSVSNMFIWLNSDKQNWYDEATPPHSTDAVEASWKAHPGFLYYFSEAEKAALMEMSITTIKNSVVAGGGTETVLGKVHLPTRFQLVGTKTSGVADGDYFDAISTSENPGVTRRRSLHPMPCLLSAEDILGKPESVMDPWWYWTATPDPTTANKTFLIHTNGGAAANVDTRRAAVVPVIYFPVTGIVTEAFEFGIQPSKTIEGKSKIYDLSKPDVSFRTVLSGNFEGASIQVFATNNAYDASPKWEDVTQAYLNNAPYSFNNATKTASSWGMQLRVVVTKTNAPAVCLKGCAFEIL